MAAPAARTFHHNEDILRSAGMAPLDDRTDAAQWRARLLSHLQALEARPPTLERPLADNLAAAAAALTLGQVEIAVLAFAVLIHTDGGLDDAADMLGHRLSNDRAGRLLAAILALPEQAVAQALAPDAPLCASGVLYLEPGPGRMQDKLCLLPGFAELMLSHRGTGTDLLACFLPPSPPARLRAPDFAHLRDDYDLLYRYLAAAVRERRPGVNCLIHGPSGTGKTELARTLARDLDLRLHEVPVAGPGPGAAGRHAAAGEPLPAQDRIQSYRLCQRLLAQGSGGLILFDEIEDAFPTSLQGLFVRQTNPKAWLNDLLETNPIPAIWISNAIWQMDQATLRRFALVLEMRHPTRSVRRRILERYLEGQPVRPAWLDRMAEHERLAPAVVERAASVAATLGERDPARLEGTVERVIGNALSALGLPRRPDTRAAQITRYRPECLNADTDLAALAAGLRRDPRGRLCLYGPPGTGKSAFGIHLARELDRPLLARRASDLLGPYLGMTEQRIARLFDEARDEDAVLLLDEADGFLRDRAGANRSWEVTQVNELLTQMESFDGLFVCSTNLMSSLDPAALRRFDLKIRFDWLRPEQAWILFKDLLALQGRRVPRKSEWLPRLAALATLTPGDFATLARQQRLAAEPLDAAAALAGLRREVELRPGGQGRAMGFTAEL